MEYSRVNAYQKKNGTAVRSHRRVKRQKRHKNKFTSRAQSPKSFALDLQEVSQIKQASIRDMRKQYMNFGEEHLTKQSSYSINNILDEKSGAAIFAGSTMGMIASLGFGAATFGLAAIAVGFIPTIARYIKYSRGFTRPDVAFAKHIKRTGEFQVTQDDQPLMEAAANSNGWTTTPRTSKSEVNGVKTTSKVEANGLGTIKGKTPLFFDKKSAKIPFAIKFFPGVNFNQEDFNFRLDLPGVNMEKADMSYSLIHSGDFSGANLKKSDWTNARIGNVNFDGANLEGANLHLLRENSHEGEGQGPSMRGANLRNANLTQANLVSFDLTGADLTGADLTGATLPKDLTGINITDEQFGSLGHYGNFGSSLANYSYGKKTFQETIEELGISEKQFEFLVISGAIKVRDNSESKPVKGNPYRQTRWVMVDGKPTGPAELVVPIYLLASPLCG